MLPDFSTEFFVALAGIVVADLLLAGDNAVVIALAARNLPKPMRRRAVLYGALAAIVLRTLLTVAMVYVLGREDVPVVRLVGGVALLYIGWQLAVQQQNDDVDDAVGAARSMRGAIRTILVADVVMSIDNVLAVAAFARDDVWLVVIGLLVSIPIVMGGASVLLRVIDRLPLLVWFGAALIAYVGMELILVDPFIHARLPTALMPMWTERAVAVAVALAVTCIAWTMRTRRAEAAAVRARDEQVRRDPDDAESRLMVERSGSDS